MSSQGSQGTTITAIRVTTGRNKGEEGIGKGGTKSHRKVQRDSRGGMIKPAIVLKASLENIIKDAVIYTEHARGNFVEDMGQFV